ncbi:MAG: TetR/AcrR family transcriptional regulator [Desulfobacteraceae bacterium]|nr:TetR/AcrR family transcriptional regulator [Desulfobacteraceae bacterium]MBC2754506.1 TetR/AcrR family transcriptional regulator [Desulfobacteraceae bacterium]
MSPENPKANPKPEPKTKPKTQTDILEKAIPLFAKSGFTGISMRQIAKAVGMNAASLYHHFPDKQTLYIAAVQQAFATREFVLSEILSMKIPVHEKLHLFLKRICDFMQNEPDFSRLIHREILDGDGDETRLRLLADQVFQNFFAAVIGLAGELAPDKDPHLLAMSIFGLVAYHYQTMPIRLFLPGGKPEHNESEIVANHVTSLLLQGLKSKKKR